MAEKSNKTTLERALEVPHIEETLRKAEKIAAFPYGDDECTVFYLFNLAGERLYYIWGVDGSISMQDTGMVKPNDVRDVVSTSEGDKKNRITSTVERIKELLGAK